VLAGVEARWLLATIDSDKFGSSTVHALDFLARIGWKF